MEDKDRCVWCKSLDERDEAILEETGADWVIRPESFDTYGHKPCSCDLRYRPERKAPKEYVCDDAHTCDECMYMEPKEDHRGPIRRSGFISKATRHICQKMNRRVFHGNMHPHLPRPDWCPIVGGVHD